MLKRFVALVRAGSTAASIGLCLAVTGLSAHANVRIIGYVTDADTQRYLYTEIHEQTLAPDGAVRQGLTTYHDAQGREIARKTLDYRNHRTVPVYRMDIPALRYAEGISASTAPSRSATLSRRQILVRSSASPMSENSC